MANKSFFVDGGTVQSREGAIYLSRSADDQLLSLCRTGTFAYVLTARQMGKSSLMVNTAEQLATEGVRTAEIDLTSIGVKVTKEEWYLGILFEMRFQLGLKMDIIEWWHAPERRKLGTAQRLLLFFEQVVLAEISEPVIIFVDEIETTLRLDFTDDFFAAVRSIHNARSGRRFERLAFVLIGVATPDSLIRDRQLTPFNIGQRVVLSDFTLHEALPLSDGFGLPQKDAHVILRRVLHWTGGHPYLTQRLCRALVEEQKDEWTEGEVDRVVSRLFFGDQSDADSNLRFVREMLLASDLDREEVLTTYRAILRESPPVLDEEQSLIKSHLKLSGVVERQGTTLQVRNHIYQEVFNESWVRDHIPVNWTRRLTRVAAVVFLALMFVSAILAPYAWAQKLKADVQKLNADKSRERAEEALRNEQRLKQQLQQAINDLREANRQLTAAKEVAEKLTEKAQIAARQEKAAKEVAETKSELAAEETVRRTQAQRSSFTSKLIATDQSLQHPNSLLERVIVARESVLQARAAEAQTAEAKTTNPLPLLAYRNLMESAMLLPRSVIIPFAGGHVSDVMFMKDRQKLLGFDDNKRTLQMWDSEKQQLSARHVAGSERVLQYRYDGKYVAIEGKDGSIIIREVESGREVVVKREPEIVVRAVPSAQAPSQSEVSKADVKLPDTTVDEVTSEADEREPGPVVVVEKPFCPPYAIFSPEDDYALIYSASSDVETLELWRISDGRKLADITNGSRLLKADFSADGRFIFVANESGNVRVFETQTGGAITNRVESNAPDKTTKRVETAPTRSSVESMKQVLLSAAVFSENRKFLVTANEEVAEVWDLSDPRAIKKVPHTFTGTSERGGLAISNDGQLLAVSSGSSSMALWDVAAGSKFLTINTIDATDDSLFSSDHKSLITISDNSFHVWDVETGTEIYRAVDKPDDKDVKGDSDRRYFKQVLLSPNGNSLVTVRGDGLTRLWDLTTDENAVRKLISSFESSAAISNDKQYAVSVAQDGSPCSSSCLPAGRFAQTTAQVWDVSTGRVVATRKFSAKISRTAFSDDGKELIVATIEGETYNTIWLWPWREREARISRLAAFTASEVNNISLSHNGKYLAALVNDKEPSVLVWNADQPGSVERQSWRLGVEKGRAISFIPGTDHLMVINDEGSRMWDVLHNRPVGSLIGRGLDGKEVETKLYDYSENGAYIAGFSKKTGNVEVMETGSGTVVAQLRHLKGVKTLDISKDGSMVVTVGDEDDMMRVWAWKEQPRIISQVKYSADSVSFNPEGAYVASTASQDSVRVWDVSRPSAIEVARIPAKGASAVLFSPDTKHLYTFDSSMLQAWQWQVNQLICAATVRLTKKSLSVKEWEEKINVLPSEKQFLQHPEVSCGIAPSGIQQ